MRESKTLEYKEQVSTTFLKTVSAFANYGTGEIKFGIRNDGTEVGVPNPEETCLDIENRINDSIHPIPEYSLSIHPKTSVITLRVQEGLHKPYLYKSKAYRRSDSATVEVERIALTRLILAGQNLSFEEMDANDSTLRFTILEKVLCDELHIKKLTPDILRTLNLLKNDKFNQAAALLADSNKFPGIDIIRFGESINIIFDRNTYDRISILKQYDNALEFYHKYYQYEEIRGALRESKKLIPEAAFREALANALVHRTWDIQAHINIAMFSDRIEITSPGGLPEGVNIENYLAGGLSVLRNPIIGQLFFRLNRIEHFGTGIRRINETYKNSQKKPLFDITDNSIKITLPVLQEKPDDLNDDQVRVFQALRNRIASSSELALLTGFGKTKIVKILKELERVGYVRSLGTGRGTKYTATNI